MKFLRLDEEESVVKKRAIFNSVINFRGHRTACNFASVLRGIVGWPKGCVNKSWHELVAKRLYLRCNQMAALKRKRLLAPS